MLLLGPTALAVVAAEADEGDYPDEENREKVVYDEKDNVAENEVDEE